MIRTFELRREESMTQQETPHRAERDSMGEVKVPRDALFGAQTRRALDNFPISDLRKPRRFVQALGAIKLEAANVNHELGLLDEGLRDAIVRAAGEVMEGELDRAFVLDVFQTGSGTSTNMNANEVISNRAIQLLGGKAVGTGVNTHPEFAKKVCERLSERFGVEVRETENHFQAQCAMDGAVFASGALKTVAVSLMKVANDIRWLGSGP